MFLSALHCELPMFVNVRDFKVYISLSDSDILATTCPQYKTPQHLPMLVLLYYISVPLSDRLAASSSGLAVVECREYCDFTA